MEAEWHEGRWIHYSFVMDYQGSSVHGVPMASRHRIGVLLNHSDQNDRGSTRRGEQFGERHGEAGQIVGGGKFASRESSVWSKSDTLLGVCLTLLSIHG